MTSIFLLDLIQTGILLILLIRTDPTEIKRQIADLEKWTRERMQKEVEE